MLSSHSFPLFCLAYCRQFAGRCVRISRQNVWIGDSLSRRTDKDALFTFRRSVAIKQQKMPQSSQPRPKARANGEICISFATPSQADTKIRQRAHERKSKTEQWRTHNLLSFGRRVEAPFTYERKPNVDDACCTCSCIFAIRSGSVLRRSGIETGRGRVSSRWTMINAWVTPTSPRNGLHYSGAVFICSVGCRRCSPEIFV